MRDTVLARGNIPRSKLVCVYSEERRSEGKNKAITVMSCVPFYYHMTVPPPPGHT